MIYESCILKLEPNDDQYHLLTEHCWGYREGFNWTLNRRTQFAAALKSAEKRLVGLGKGTPAFALAAAELQRLEAEQANIRFKTLWTEYSGWVRSNPRMVALSASTVKMALIEEERLYFQHTRFGNGRPRPISEEDAYFLVTGNGFWVRDGIARLPKIGRMRCSNLPADIRPNQITQGRVSIRKGQWSLEAFLRAEPLEESRGKIQ